MFYLLLGCFFIALFWILLGTYKVMIAGEIKKGGWSGDIHFTGWKQIFGIKWQIRSDFAQSAIIHAFFIPIPVRFHSRKREPKKTIGKHSVRHFIMNSKQKFGKMKSIRPLIQQIFKRIQLHCLKITGHIGFLDPATAGIILGLIQGLRSFSVSPLDIRITPRFYPVDSYAMCRMEMEFQLFSILCLLIQERKTWKPLVSGS